MVLKKPKLVSTHFENVIKSKHSLTTTHTKSSSKKSNSLIGVTRYSFKTIYINLTTNIEWKDHLKSRETAIPKISKSGVTEIQSQL